MEASPLRQLREKQGVALREFARQLKISAAYLCDLEHGRRMPIPPLLRKIQEVYGQGVGSQAEIIAEWFDLERTQRWVHTRFPEIEEEQRTVFVKQILAAAREARANGRPKRSAGRK